MAFQAGQQRSFAAKKLGGFKSAGGGNDPESLLRKAAARNIAMAKAATAGADALRRAKASKLAVKVVKAGVENAPQI